VIIIGRVEVLKKIKSYFRFKFDQCVQCLRNMEFFVIISLFMLINNQFAEEETDPYRRPTKYNMRLALSWLVQGCQPGDSLVFHFSGHGSQQKDQNGDELDGYDETLCPTDFETQGMIVDDEINEIIVKPLSHGVKLHAIIDACHSGTVLDLPFLCRMDRFVFSRSFLTKNVA